MDYFTFATQNSEKILDVLINHSYFVYELFLRFHQTFFIHTDTIVSTCVVADCYMPYMLCMYRMLHTEIIKREERKDVMKEERRMINEVEEKFVFAVNY